MKLLLSALIVAVALGLAAEPVLAQDPDSRGQDIHFRGPVKEIVRDLNGDPTQFTVRVNRAQVQLILTPWTQVFRALGFRAPSSQLEIDDFVEVNGFFIAGGRILARQIHVESRDAVEAVGSVESVNGDWVHVNGIDFLLDADSRIRRAGQELPGTRGEIQAGSPVRLRGQFVGGLLRVEEIEYGPRTVEDDPLRFEGIIRELENGLLSIDVGVSATNALASVGPSTFISGDVVPGRLVEVEGRFIPGTALVAASRITVDGNSNGNVYDDDLEDGSNVVELQGTILEVSRRVDGSVSGMVVDRTSVILNSQTSVQYADGLPAPHTAILVGKPVVVDGILQFDGSLLAGNIEIKEDSPQPEPDEVQLEGVIKDLIRNSSNGTVSRITVNATLVFLDATTRVFREGDPVSSSKLKKDQRVELEGFAQNDGSILASEIRIQQEVDPPDPDPEELELEGEVQSLTRLTDGSVSEITVKGVSVRVDATTMIKKEGKAVGSDQLEQGQEVHVKALKQPDNHYLAKEIEIQ